MESFSKLINQSKKCLLISFATIALVAGSVFAQDGTAGISEATNKVKGYFSTGTDLIYAISMVSGLLC